MGSAAVLFLGRARAWTAVGPQGPLHRARALGSIPAVPLAAATAADPSQAKSSAGKEARRKAKKEAAPQASEPNLPSLVRLLLEPGLRLLASLPRIIWLKRLRIQGRLGFADPAQTGRVYGYLRAVAARKGKVQINVSPDFVRTGAFGRLDLVAHLHLGLLILLLGRFGSQAAYRLLAARFRTPI